MTQIASSISSALRNHLVIGDPVFDKLFPSSLRFRSRVHWTSVEIAMSACMLLAPGPNRRVLDVGSGVGKLCLVGSLITRSSWTGIEKDTTLVHAARNAAAKLGASNSSFVHGDATAFDWSGFDAIYLFNPFAEILGDTRLDPMARRDRYSEMIARARDRLSRTNPGTRVVTYHGLGGEMPQGFALRHRQPAGGDELCLWTRVRHGARSTDELRGAAP